MLDAEGKHRKARRRVAIALGVLQLCTACYSFVPVVSSPNVGAHVALEVNDEGRIALREQLGPGVLRLEGRLAAVDNTDLVLDASRVTQIRGLALPVDSMRVRLSQSFVARMDERRLSRTRTWLTVGGAIALVAAFIATDGFSGRGVQPDREPVGPPVNERRGM
jgi:hypothetical protein